MTKRPLPTPEELRQLLHYDPETGFLIWRTRSEEMFAHGLHGQKSTAAFWNRLHSGKRADNLSLIGYCYVSVWGRGIPSHRVCWAIHYGRWPKQHIDHVDHDRANNRIDNLRDVPRLENMRNQKLSSNNKSGVTGVHWSDRLKKWSAQITVGGKTLYLGVFSEKADAINARREAESRMGFHSNHGK